MKTATLLATLALAAGCVPMTITGEPGVPVDMANRPQNAAPQPLVVTASEAASYSTTYLGLVEVTFENRTPVWKQVVRVAVDFGTPAKNRAVTIATADEIDAWERAIKFRWVTAGKVVTTAIEARGLGLSVDTLGTWFDAHPRSTPPGDTAAESPPPPAYPAQHLLTTPFVVPPGLFAKRWILLSTPDNPPGGCIDSMILTYETSDHQTGRVRLPFKVTSSDWQARACYRTVPANPAGNP